MPKNIKQDIQKRFREIEVHRSHGLYAEARDMCRALADTIRRSDRLKNKKALLDMVSQKIRDLEHDLREFEKAGASAQMPQTEQDIITPPVLFPAEGKEEPAVAAGAETLLISGHFEMALAEFNKLVEQDPPKISTAKNILRCFIGLSALKDAVSQYRQWFSNGCFSAEEMGRMHYFLREVLGKKKIDLRIPEPDNVRFSKENDAGKEAYIDVLSIVIPRGDASQADDGIHLDVNFQRRRTISVIIPQKERTILESLKVDSMLNDVMFFTPSVIYRDSCVISRVQQIKSGPRKGDYTLMIKMT